MNPWQFRALFHLLKALVYAELHIVGLWKKEDARRALLKALDLYDTWELDHAKGLSTTPRGE